MVNVVFLILQKGRSYLQNENWASFQFIIKYIHLLYTTQKTSWNFFQEQFKRIMHYCYITVWNLFLRILKFHHSSKKECVVTLLCSLSMLIVRGFEGQYYSLQKNVWWNMLNVGFYNKCWYKQTEYKVCLEKRNQSSLKLTLSISD